MSASPDEGGRAATLRAAGAMGTATFLSRVMGLVREQVFAWLFGAGHATDAFQVAFRIPNLLRDLFAEGAMSAALVPTFTEVRAKRGADQAWRLAGLTFRALFVVVTVITLLGMLFAEPLVGFYASAFRADPEKFALTVRLTRWMYPFFPLVALAAAFMGILNACGVFFLPAFASALFNIASVFVGATLALLGPRLGWSMHPIEGMAIGVLAGGVLQAGCQLPALYRQGYRWVQKREGDLSWREEPGLRRILRMMVPGTIGMAATQINILVNTVLATAQGPGAVSWLSYAFRLMQFPIGIFGVSFGAASLPRLSKLWVEERFDEVSSELRRSISHVLALNLPASMGLSFLSVPIIRVLFEHGRFSADDTRATALALSMYAIGLGAYSVVKVLVPACYAVGNTRLPVVSSMLSVALTIVLNLLMVKPFGYWGLALGTSVAAIFNALFLLFSVRMLLNRRAHFPILPLGAIVLRQLALSFSMGWAAFLIHLSILAGVFKIGLNPEFFVFQGVALLAAVVGGALWVWGWASVFKVAETTEIFDLFYVRIKNKLLRRVG